MYHNCIFKCFFNDGKKKAKNREINNEYLKTHTNIYFNLVNYLKFFL